MKKKIYTIKDIAKIAQLSRGTVDKVLHNRGGVSQETIDRVMEIIHRVDYKPNLLARTLKQLPERTIGVLFPAPGDMLYWSRYLSGVQQGAQELASTGGKVHFHTYERSKKSFEMAFRKMLAESPDACLIVPLQFEDTTSLYKELTDRNIPLYFMNSMIDHIAFNSFIGQDHKKSGRLAAHLLKLTDRFKGNLLIVHHMESDEMATHLQYKEEGFREYCAQAGFQYKIHTLTIKGAQSEDLLSEQLKSVSGVFLSSSFPFQAIGNLDRFSRPGIITYDLTPFNLTLLKEGYLDIILYQNPFGQGKKAVLVAGEDLWKQRKDRNKMDYMPVDIITSENVDTYLDK